MSPEQAFGRYIRAQRLDRCWTLERLADEVGISRTFLSQIELGRRNPTLKVVASIAFVFGLSVQTILDKSGYLKLLKDSRRGVVK